MIARLVNFWRRHIHRHPAATARRVESERARKARIRKVDEDRARCVMLAKGFARQRQESVG